VAGRATHQITAGPSGLDQDVYIRLRREGLVDAAAPVISEYISSPQLGGSLLQLLGIDPFVDAPFREYLGNEAGNQQGAKPRRQPAGALTAFLTHPGAIFISADLAQRFDLQDCASRPVPCEISLEAGGTRHTAVIAGLLQPSDPLSRQALENILLADVATAQEITGRLGRLDRIDLILPPTDPELEDQIREWLPAGAQLVEVEARQGTVEQMTAAFRVNLTALSLLALVVGLFLIYNTMTFSVVQRRPLFGTLRCLGATRREVFLLVAGEALLVGLLGAALGALFGIVLGQAALRLVTQTINDLFFVTTVRGVQIPITSLMKGAVLGVVATVAAASPPAWEAASVPPRLALSRSGLEMKARRAVIYAAVIGLILLGLGSIALLYPSRDLTLSFAATFAIIIGSALLAPLTTLALMRLSLPVAGAIWGSLGRMAPRNVISSLSRTSIAVAALMVAVSVTIGVSLMVSSFRYTVIAWLDQTLIGDVYISAPSLTSTQTSAPVEGEVIQQLENWPGVDQVYTLRSATVDSPMGETHIAASSDERVSDHRSYLSTSVPVEQVKDEMRRGAVIISEPYANRMGIRKPYRSLPLNTTQGIHEFPVVGVYYDYASTQGTVLMALDVYRQHWLDDEITAVALKLSPGTDVNEVVTDLRSALSNEQRLIIRANQTLRQEVLQVFDRTFAITRALQLLATVVAFIGVLSALLSLELERQRELGILRAVGLTTRQMWGLISLETGLMGAAAGLLAIPTGYLLSLILVYIINRRSFGWTLQMHVVLEPFLAAFIVAVGAALLAGIYPARRVSRMLAAEAIRYE
jgi:putative ABC transport system permease protein